MNITSPSEPPWRIWLDTIFTGGRAEQRRREEYIANYQFPRALRERFRIEHPELTDKQQMLVWSALREYFQLCRMARHKMVAMPSIITDDAWHDFILFTREYHDFCSNAFGRYLHHSPATGSNYRAMTDASLLAWQLACKRMHQPPSVPLQLPLLYAVDADLKIPGAPAYSLQELTKRFRMDSRTSGGGSGGSDSSCGGSGSGGGCSDAGSNDGGCGDGGGSSCGGGCGGGGSD
jgi:hypothetical protein